MLDAALALSAALAAQGVVHCAGDTTVEVNRCAQEELAKADATLTHYLAAARKRLADNVSRAGDDRSAVEAQRSFESGETAWEAYRDQECGAVYAYWSSGTIRTVQSLDCKVYLTRLRTHTVWRHWLTYPDSTPPILPEPAL